MSSSIFSRAKTVIRVVSNPSFLFCTVDRKITAPNEVIEMTAMKTAIKVSTSEVPRSLLAFHMVLATSELASPNLSVNAGSNCRRWKS